MIIRVMSDSGSGKLAVIEAGLQAVREEYEVILAPQTELWALLDRLKAATGTVILVDLDMARLEKRSLRVEIISYMERHRRRFWLLNNS